MDRDRTPPPLRPVEFQVLLSLAAGERHGYGMIQDAAERGERLDVGTLYRALARMVDQRLIATVRGPIAESEDGRRNYYRVLPRGLKAARAEARRVAALAREARNCGLLEPAT